MQLEILVFVFQAFAVIFWWAVALAILGIVVIVLRFFRRPAAARSRDTARETAREADALLRAFSQDDRTWCTRGDEGAANGDAALAGDGTANGLQPAPVQVSPWDSAWPEPSPGATEEAS